jgi:hypothetical protein
LLNRGNQTIEQFCEQNNVAISTVGKWQSNCANVLDMKTKKINQNIPRKNITNNF